MLTLLVSTDVGLRLHSLLTPLRDREKHIVTVAELSLQLNISLGDQLVKQHGS
jgi:hypothetical protein